MRFVANDPELTGETLNALYTAVGWNDDQTRTSEKTQLVLERTACFVAAWDGDTLIGFGRVFADVYWAQILDVMTHPDYRRRGVAKGVVSRLISYADKEQLSLMLIAAGGLEKLYARFGFTVTNPATDVLMYRPLPQPGEDLG